MEATSVAVPHHTMSLYWERTLPNAMTLGMDRHLWLLPMFETPELRLFHRLNVARLHPS